jgi:hypothetical protein
MKLYVQGNNVKNILEEWNHHMIMSIDIDAPQYFL